MLRDRRKQLRITQEQLAEKSKLHPTYISMIENGRTNLSIGVMLKLMHILKINPCVFCLHLEAKEACSKMQFDVFEVMDKLRLKNFRQKERILSILKLMVDE